MFDFVTSWTAVCQAPQSSTISRSLLKLMSIELVMLSNHLNLWCHLLLLPSIFPSIRVFFSELALCIRWPKYWSFSCSISPSNEYSGLIAFRIDWFDLLAVQETLKSLLQHPNSKHQFFNVQSCLWSNSHIHTWLLKKNSFAIWTFVGKVMSLYFNTLSRFVIAFLPRKQASSNFMAAVTICSHLGDQEKKICHCFYFFSFNLPWSDWTGCHDLSFRKAEF